MPPLDQFKNMPKEPQLWERDKVEQDNRDYSAPLKVPSRSKITINDWTVLS